MLLELDNLAAQAEQVHALLPAASLASRTSIFALPMQPTPTQRVLIALGGPVSFVNTG
ncbi:hypothetical protein D3C87_2042630 [compost metagenome]